MDSAQPALFYESMYEAMAADVAACGGPSKVGAWMFPHLAHNPDRAAAQVRACLNPNRDERFDPDQLLLLKRKAKDAGSTATIIYEGQQLDFRPEWIEPDDEMEALLRENRELQKAANQRMARIEALLARQPSRR